MAAPFIIGARVPKIPAQPAVQKIDVLFLIDDSSSFASGFMLGDGRSQKITVARIFRKSAIGEPYVDFQPPDGFDTKSAQPADFLREGDSVPVEQTQNPLESGLAWTVCAAGLVLGWLPGRNLSQSLGNWLAAWQGKKPPCKNPQYSSPRSLPSRRLSP